MTTKEKQREAKPMSPEARPAPISNSTTRRASKRISRNMLLRLR